MEIKKTMEINFTEKEEEALKIVYDIFDNACDTREEEKGCGDCPLKDNCPLGSGNRVEVMKNFIKKIAE